MWKAGHWTTLKHLSTLILFKNVTPASICKTSKFALLGTGRVRGRVVRSLGGDSGSELGLILTPDFPSARVVFNAESSGDSHLDVHSLELEDEVEFELVDNCRTDLRVAKHIQIICKNREKRELGQVSSPSSKVWFITSSTMFGSDAWTYTDRVFVLVSVYVFIFTILNLLLSDKETLRLLWIGNGSTIC